MKVTDIESARRKRMTLSAPEELLRGSMRFCGKHLPSIIQDARDGDMRAFVVLMSLDGHLNHIIDRMMEEYEPDETEIWEIGHDNVAMMDYIERKRSGK